MREWLASVLLLAACDDKHAPPAPLPPAPAIAPRVPADADPVDAASADAPRARLNLPPLSKGWVDEPAWPAGGGPLALAWLVYPQGEDPPLTPVQLVATIGDVSRTITLGPEPGGLKPWNQSACAGKLGDAAPLATPLGPHELASLVFSDGSDFGYTVRRARADVLEVISWDQPDGACPGKHGELVGCPPLEKLVVRLHVPANVAVREELLELDATGGRHAFQCS